MACYGTGAGKRPLDAVEGVEIVERGLDDGVDVYGGTLRNCLGIRTAPGVELFVVSGIERQIVQLEGLLGSNR